MQELSDCRRWILCPDAVATVLTDGAVVLDLRSKYFYSANPTAWAIIQLFEVGATRAEVQAASKSWGAGEADAPAINDIIDQLIAENLLQPAEGPAPVLPPVIVAGWVPPSVLKHREPLQRIMVSAFDPGLPLAE